MPFPFPCLTLVRTRLLSPRRRLAYRSSDYLQARISHKAIIAITSDYKFQLRFILGASRPDVNARSCDHQCFIFPKKLSPNFQNNFCPLIYVNAKLVMVFHTITHSPSRNPVLTSQKTSQSFPNISSPQNVVLSQNTLSFIH